MWTCVQGGGWGLILAICSCVASVPIYADHSEKLDEFLRQGELDPAETYFREVLAQDATDHQARVALGITQFLQAVEFLGQTNYRFGLLHQHARQIPLARIPVPLNPHPEKVSYDKLRAALDAFGGKLATAEATLADAKTASVHLQLYLGRVRLDLDGDGKRSDEETLWRIFAAVNSAVGENQGEEFYVGVDGADVHWLRGYCHFLMAICDVVLAYDERELFERCGQLIFPQIESPYRAAAEPVVEDDSFEMTQVVDAVAAIHLVRFKLTEPARMKSAHGHLVAMIAESRSCWERAETEMDDDQEWIPNEKQTSVVGMRVPTEIISGWKNVLDELEAILQGDKLIPYWREYYRKLFGNPQCPAEGTGVNLEKFFLEPRDFDLVLAIQGTGVEPYLAEGPLSTPEVWTELTRVFRGQFFGFAVWFN